MFVPNSCCLDTDRLLHLPLPVRQGKEFPGSEWPAAYFALLRKAEIPVSMQPKLPLVVETILLYVGNVMPFVHSTKGSMSSVCM